MWNIAITIISPACSKPFNLFHDKDIPDVIIVANGGAWLSEKKRTTHFNGTRSTDAKFRIPGSEIVNPNLNPVILDSAAEARNLSLKNFIKDEEHKVLDRLRLMSKAIERLEDKAANLIKDADKLRHQKKNAEFQLEQLNISIENIKKAGKLKDRVVVRSSEREKEDLELEKQKEKDDDEKRKHDDEQNVESASKKLKVQPETSEGELMEIEDDISMLMSVSEERKLMKDELVKQITKEVRYELLTTSVPQIIQPQQQPQMILQQRQKEAVQEPAQIVTIPQQSTGLPPVRPGSIEEYLSEKGLTYLPLRQASATITSEAMQQAQPTIMNFPVTTSVAETSTLNLADLVVQQPQPQMMTIPPSTTLPTGSQSVDILVERPSRSSTRLRTSTEGPVPKDKQDPRRHYCDKCPCNYTRKDELKYHKTYNCLVVEKQFICDVCNAEYYEKDGLKMHYYRKHLNTFLYFCKKCNKGFMYKSRLSGHKNACPNKDGPDQYPGKAPEDPELNKKFVRRSRISVDPDVITALDILEEQNRCDAGRGESESEQPQEYPQAVGHGESDNPIGEPQQPEHIETETPIGPNDGSQPSNPDNDE